jgi:LTXXQ motif family protein
MKKKVLLIGGIAAAVVLAGGFAFAQSTGHGHGGFGPHSMRGEGGGMGPGMHGQMGQGMHGMMGGGMHGMMGGGMHGMMGGMRHGGQGTAFADPAEIQDLKAELGITAAQEPAWTRYTKALQDAAAAVKSTRESVDRDAVGRMTPQDRFAFVTRMREQAQKQHETLTTAATELLAALDEKQKEIAEDSLPGLVPFGPGTRGAGMGGQHRH